MKPPRYSIKNVAMTTAVIAVLVAICVWYLDIPHAPVEKVAGLHGQTDVSVLTRLGTPTHEYTFTMKDPLGEFRIELYNTYPPNSPNNENIEIRECTWDYSRHRLTVWFHKPDGKWVALDTCRYRYGITF